MVESFFEALMDEHFRDRGTSRMLLCDACFKARRDDAENLCEPCASQRFSI
jgi:hypothetical protein